MVFTKRILSLGRHDCLVDIQKVGVWASLVVVVFSFAHDLASMDEHFHGDRVERRSRGGFEELREFCNYAYYAGGSNVCH